MFIYHLFVCFSGSFLFFRVVWFFGLLFADYFPNSLYCFSFLFFFPFVIISDSLVFTPLYCYYCCYYLSSSKYLPFLLYRLFLLLFSDSSLAPCALVAGRELLLIHKWPQRNPLGLRDDLFSVGRMLPGDRRGARMEGRGDRGVGKKMGGRVGG